jgi:hypothetical protein
MVLFKLEMIQLRSVRVPRNKKSQKKILPVPGIEPGSANSNHAFDA